MRYFSRTLAHPEMAKAECQYIVLFPTRKKGEERSSVKVVVPIVLVAEIYPNCYTAGQRRKEAEPQQSRCFF